MRDYLEELLAGTEDALDQAEAEWTEGVSPPCPADPRSGGGGGRPGGAGEKRRGRRDGQGWEKLDRNRAGGAVSIRRDRAVLESRSGRNSRKVRQG